MHIDISVDVNARTPLARQLYEEMRRLILSGKLSPGSVVPSSRTLAVDLGIGRSTVIEAYDQLKIEGYIQGKSGSRTIVSERLPKIASSISPQKSSPPVLRRANLSAYGQRVAKAEMFDPANPELEINFYGWRPALDLAPVRQLTQVFARLARTWDVSLLEYPSDPLGYKPLREAIARSLARARGIKCGAEQIMIVCGLPQALSLIARVHIERGDLVAVENPSYPGIRQSFQLEGAELCPIEVDQEGICVDKLAAISDQKIRLAYVCPSHQMPTGSMLSLERKLKLLSWAAHSGSLIVEDEHDGEFHFSGKPIPPLKALDDRDQVIFVGSFHRVLFPALAMAYLVLPKHLVDVYSRARNLFSDQPPSIMQATLATFINEGFLRRHLRRMMELYGSRRETFLTALEKHLGERVWVSPDNAGMHVLVRFKTRLSSSKLVKLAAERGVGVVSTAGYYVGSYPPGEFVLGYANLSDRKIRDGMKRLGQILVE